MGRQSRQENDVDQSGSGESGKDGLFLGLFGDRDDSWGVDYNRTQARSPDFWPELFKARSCHSLR